MKTYAVIMAGGSGTRFWPKSSQKNPKQLLALTGKESQLVLTWKRLDGLVDKSRRVIVSTESLTSAIKKQIPKPWILGEPVGRNTMAAVCWSTWTISQKDPEALVAVLPADAYVKDVPQFQSSMIAALEMANSQGRIVCLGIKPTYAATGYGYIRQGSSLSGGFEIQEFVEKPHTERAAGFLTSGEYLWNAGIFVFRADIFKDEVRRHAPEMASFFDGGFSKKNYKKLPSISIDVALMEKTSRGALISGDFGWNDLGSWPALAEVLSPNDPAGIIKAPAGHVAIGSKNIIADVSGKKFLGLIGVENLIVVETENAILVCDRNKAQEIKTLVSEIQKKPKWAKKLL